MGIPALQKMLEIAATGKFRRTIVFTDYKNVVGALKLNWIANWDEKNYVGVKRPYLRKSIHYLPCTFYSKRLHCSSYTPSVLLELRTSCNSLLYFKKLVGNAQVIAKSYHKPLINMLTYDKESSSKFMKYINVINEFETVEVMFIEGKKYIPADFLFHIYIKKVMISNPVKDSSLDPNKMKGIFINIMIV
uniref:RNase H domain-containing protein n=1 Tax=Strongyloides venezuelensis TaxID=75913 RepID=A0A0K0FRI2_STRVS